MTERTRSDLSTLLGEVLSEESPPADVLARYARDPDALTPEERRLMEFHWVNTPFVRDQIAVIRALITAPAARTDAMGARRGPLREGPGAPRRARPWHWTWVGGAVAAGVAAVLLLQSDRWSRLEAENPARVATTVPDPAPSAADAPARQESPGGTATAQAPSAPPSTPESAPDPSIAKQESERPQPSPEDRSESSPAQLAQSERPSSSRPAPPDAPPAETRTAETPGEETPGELRAEIVVAQLLRIDRSGESPSIDLDIGFADASAELTPAGRRDLQAVGGALTDPRMAGYRFRLAVHTDDRGAVAENQVLSERRAAAVVDYLRSNFEIPSERIEGVGRGETEPVAEGTTDAIRAINRRVTLERVAFE